MSTVGGNVVIACASGVTLGLYGSRVNIIKYLMGYVNLINVFKDTKKYIHLHAFAFSKYFLTTSYLDY